jgi:hypothetical protein
MLETESELGESVYTVQSWCMHKAQRKSKANLRMDAFEAEMVRAAQFYNLQAARGLAKCNAPLAEAAFIAGACWAKQVLLGQGNE